MPDSPNDRSDADTLQDVLKSISPLWLLNTVMAKITKRVPHQPSEPPWKDVGLSHTRGEGATPEDIAAMNRKADARQSMLEADPRFQAALARLVAAGVLPKWTGDEDYSFTARVLRLFVPLFAMSNIEALAASDAGIDLPHERLEAAERYRRWLLQSYHPEWERYRAHWPVLYENPYNTALNDFGKQPSRTSDRIE